MFLNALLVMLVKALLFKFKERAVRFMNASLVKGLLLLKELLFKSKDVRAGRLKNALLAMLVMALPDKSTLMRRSRLPNELLAILMKAFLDKVKYSKTGS